MVWGISEQNYNAEGTELMSDDPIDIDELKARLEKLPDAQKAALMAPALIYIGRALDEFGEQRAAIKVAEAAIILISNMTAQTDEDLRDQQKTIVGLHSVIDHIKQELSKKKDN